MMIKIINFPFTSLPILNVIYFFILNIILVSASLMHLKHCKTSYAYKILFGSIALTFSSPLLFTYDSYIKPNIVVSVLIASIPTLLFHLLSLAGIITFSIGYIFLIKKEIQSQGKAKCGK